MSIFFWKKNKIIDTSANQLANDFFSYVPPSLVESYFQQTARKKEDNKESRKNRKKLEANLHNLVKQVEQFRITHSLGTYGKARFQLKFNERLQELGYDKKVVDKLSEYILLKIP